ncbi:MULTISPECIES: HD domain-containing protein [Sphingobium]|uniref:HD domain-containing protein n=1 Tax=Sphingobium sp. MI1205 TaxID=407020 RepID=UPI00077009EF|nr:ATP-binding protein [Sphingobium sp. MI1205]AMK19633.1 ATPase domain-containing protein [Sphingobium sp. MI1205]
MAFKQTPLWKAAFEEARDDATADEQLRLAKCYEAMRERAAALVAKIATDLPHMTVHNVSHLDALWEMGSIACGKSVDLNPAEAFVFGGAVLLHDAAMTLAAFPGGLEELKQQTEWRDLHARYMTSVAPDDASGAAEAEKRATADALRLLHAKQAEHLPMISWLGPHQQPMFLIEDQQIRNFYGPKIGKIAFSHWWSIAKVDQDLSGTLGGLPNVTNCTVDLLKVACLLRVADAMHLDQRRAPAFEFALTQPEGISADHWKFQERMATPYVHGDALVYTAQPPFDVSLTEAWWTAFDALQMVDRELRDVDRVLRDRQRQPLAVRRVDGAHTPSDLARTIETVGWMPVDTTIRVTDVQKIVSTLGGSKLYGTGLAAPVRELIQNGLDAITARRRLQNRPDWGELRVILQKRGDDYWLCFEDNGVGMSPLVLTGPLIDFGNSFWRSSLAIQEFPGLASAGMSARGKYGIGFFSVFMLGDQVRVTTRRFDREIQSAKLLEFRNGLGSRPNLRDADPKDVPLDGGTRVEVLLRPDPTEPDGLLHEKGFDEGTILKIKDVIAAIAPACDVTISVFEDDQPVGAIKAGDWIDIDTATLLGRINGDEDISSNVQSWAELAALRDADGKLYGRARIDAASEWYSSGLLTVDGLAAGKIGLIAGILVGVETTASRNAATPIVPAPVLAAWASDQAIALCDAEVPDEEKAKAAAIVLACGGDVADLPIIYYQDEWMSSSRFAEALESADRLVLHEGAISHDDDDEVTKREFESSFKAHSKIAQTVNGRYTRVQSTDWIVAVTQGRGETPLRVIEALVEQVWGEAESDDDTVSVGESNGTDIYRSVTVYSRPDDDEEAD